MSPRAPKWSQDGLSDSLTSGQQAPASHAPTAAAGPAAFEVLPTTQPDAAAAAFEVLPTAQSQRLF